MNFSYSYKPKVVSAFLFTCFSATYIVFFTLAQRLIYRGYNLLIFYNMKDLTKKYETAKKRALRFMQLGEIAAYIEVLAEMNKYKRQMTVIAYN